MYNHYDLFVLKWTLYQTVSQVEQQQYQDIYFLDTLFNLEVVGHENFLSRDKKIRIQHQVW